jgi:hypothetical protein
VKSIDPLEAFLKCSKDFELRGDGVFVVSDSALLKAARKVVGCEKLARGKTIKEYAEILKLTSN